MATIPRCPHCGKPMDGMGIPGATGARVWCVACGLLAIVAPAEPEGLRRPTRAERNAAQSNPLVMAERAAWLHSHAPVRYAARARRLRAGFSRLETVILILVAVILLGLPVLYLWR